MSEPVERGPNYDWKHEAKHYRDECDRLRELLRKVEHSAEVETLRLSSEIDRLREDIVAVNTRLRKANREAREWERLAGAWMDDYDKLKEKYEPMVVVLSDDCRTKPDDET